MKLVNTDLAIGTVQFGLPYGVTNASGQISKPEVRRILAVANSAGICILDTAAQYGDAEDVLGEVLDTANSFEVITKTVNLPAANDAGVAAVIAGFERSLERLRVPKVHGLLVHRHDDLMGPAGEMLFAALSKLRDEGRVGRLGVSVYAPEEAIALATRFPISLVQIPMSALDQRLVRNGALKQLIDRGIEVHVRSLFLQGALLAPEKAVARGLSQLDAPLRAFTGFARDHSMTPLQAALAFVRAQPVSAAVVGVTSARELSDIVDAWESVAKMPPLPWSKLDGVSPDALDPRRWRS